MKTDRARLLRDLATLVRTLPDSTLEQLATELEELSELPTSKLIRKLSAKAPSAGARVEVMELLSRWHQLAPDLASDRLGWALRAAAEMDRYHRERQRLELVWTGPLPEGAVLRRTAQALLEVITLSRHALLLVTFAAYDLKVVATALDAAIERGVAVTLVLESTKESQEKLTLNASHAFSSNLLKHATVLVWPAELRHQEEGKSGVMHAKCAVSDGERLFVSSANLTGHAHTLNMELGLLVTGGEEPRRVSQHFETLYQEGTLRRQG